MRDKLMGGWHAFWVVMVVAVLWSGCFSAEPGGDGDRTSTAATPGLMPTNVTYSYPCPTSGATERTKDVCAASITSPTGSLFGPRGVVHPGDPDTIVLAVNGAPSGAAAPEQVTNGAFLVEVALRVTTDAGQTWVTRAIPLDPVETHATESPAFVASVEGLVVLESDLLAVLFTLRDVDDLVSGQTGNPGAAPRTYLVLSPDLGESWGPAQRLEAPDDVNVVPTMSGVDDRLVVGWHDTRADPQTLHLSWGIPSGAVWAAQEHVTLSDEVRNWMVHQGEVLMVSSTELDERRFARIGHFDLASKTLTWRGGVPVPFATLVSGASERLHAFAFFAFSMNGPDGQVVWAASDDAGQTWHEPRVAVMGSVPLQEDNTLGAYLLRAVRGDAMGLLHFVFEMPFHESPVTQGPYAPEGREWQVEHVVVDPAQPDFRQRVRLTPEDWLTERRMPPSIGPDFEASNSGISDAAVLPVRDGVLVAWAFDRAIDYTILRADEAG